MKKRVARLREDELRKTYPIRGSVEGWFFRQEETSNGAWLVEGTDLWGRRVSQRGEDPGLLLRECEKEAREIWHKTKESAA